MNAAFSVLYRRIPAGHNDDARRRHPQANLKRFVGSFFAKPPPSANFDLDAIEAFESKLDLKEEAFNDGFDHNDDADDDVLIDETGRRKTTADIKILVVPTELAKKRIDSTIATILAEEKISSSSSTTLDFLSRSFCGKLVAEGCVSVDGEIVKRKSFKVSPGQTIQVRIPTVDESMTEIVKQNLPLQILYEDEHMIVLNKAANMVVHPGAGNWNGTVLNALAYYLTNNSTHGTGECFASENLRKETTTTTTTTTITSDDAELFFRPGVVHRLDKGTTGVLVVAKTAPALAALSDQFANRTVSKTYLAITVGNPGKNVVIDKPIGRHPIHRTRMRVVPDPHQRDSSGRTPQSRIRLKGGGTKNKSNGRRAISFVDTIAYDGKLSLVQVKIETGRTHQIRVHCQDRQTPIYGDDVYGLTSWNKQLSKRHQIHRPLLHAHQLQLHHPITSRKMIFRAPLPDDMLRIGKAIYPKGVIEMPQIFGTK